MSTHRVLLAIPDVEVATRAKYASLSGPEGAPRDKWPLKARGLEILRLWDAEG